MATLRCPAQMATDKVNSTLSSSPTASQFECTQEPPMRETCFWFTRVYAEDNVIANNYKYKQCSVEVSITTIGPLILTHLVV